MARRHFLQDDHASVRIEPPDVISLLHSEPQHSILIENGSVRVGNVLVREGVLDDLAGPRIKLADIPFEIRSEPDVARETCRKLLPKQV